MRSKLKVIMEVLGALKEGPLLKTHIMKRSMTNWKDCRFALMRLVDRKFVLKQGTVYSITGDGFELLSRSWSG